MLIEINAYKDHSYRNHSIWCGTRTPIEINANIPAAYSDIH